MEKFLKYLFSWVAFITIVVPILSPIFLIVYIFRIFIEIGAKLFRPDLVKRLNSTEYIYSIDKLYKRPFSNNILLISTKESLTLEQVQYGFTKSVLEKRTRGNNLEFIKLFLHPKEFCSYFFWKKVEYFDIKQYTKEISVKNQEDIDAFLADWIMQPYGNGKSPWEIALIRILEKDSTFVALKIHNVISCSDSFPQILDAMVGNQPKTIASTSKRNLLHDVNLFLKMPYILFQIYMQEIENHEYSSTTRYNSEVICSRVEIPTTRLKNRTKMNLNVALTSSLSGALSRFYIEEKCNKSNNNFPDLKTAKCYSSNDPILRVLEMERESKENEINISEINRIQVPLLSIFPKRVLRAIFGAPNAPAIRHTTVTCSIDEEKSNILWGKPVTDFYFISGLSRPNWGIALSTTQNSISKMGCCITASKDVIPNQDAANTTMRYFKNEIKELLLLAHNS